MNDAEIGPDDVLTVEPKSRTPLHTFTDEALAAHDRQVAEGIAQAIKAAGRVQVGWLDEHATVRESVRAQNAYEDAISIARAYSLTPRPAAPGMSVSGDVERERNDLREVVARALVQYQTNGLCRFGEVCYPCDCLARDRDKDALVQADAALADGLAEVLREHERIAGPINGMTTGPMGTGWRIYCRCKWSGWDHAPAGDIYAAHLADVVRAWLRGTG